jgi:hypothetical protein
MHQIWVSPRDKIYMNIFTHRVCCNAGRAYKGHRSTMQGNPRTRIARQGTYMEFHANAAHGTHSTNMWWF